MSLATTKMSSKGQVVIPEDIRKQMGLVTGDQFIVVNEKDAVILKAIKRPSLKEFDFLIQKARKAAKEAGFTKQEMVKIVKQSRKK